MTQPAGAAAIAGATVGTLATTGEGDAAVGDGMTAGGATQPANSPSITKTAPAFMRWSSMSNVSTW
jgi:hypothetical protein